MAMALTADEVQPLSLQSDEPGGLAEREPSHDADAVQPLDRARLTLGGPCAAIEHLGQVHGVVADPLSQQELCRRHVRHVQHPLPHAEVQPQERPVVSRRHRVS